MYPFPVFENLHFPTDFQLGPFRCVWLRGVNYQEDFTAVTENAENLFGLFGNTWPDQLTLDENLTDLHWHEREFTMKRSFAWIIRDAQGTYLGCCYLVPSWTDADVGKATYWMVKPDHNSAALAAFGRLYRDWLTQVLPKTYTLKFFSNQPTSSRQGHNHETS